MRRSMILGNSPIGGVRLPIRAVQVRYARIKNDEIDYMVVNWDRGRGERHRTDAPPARADAGFLDVSSLNSPPSAMRVPSEEQMVASFGPGIVRVRYQVARAWACRNGLCNKYQGLNLVAVNAWRRTNDMPQIILSDAIE
jgi:hypothetical protein